MSCQDEMTAGTKALGEGEPNEAFEHFAIAHALGHDVRHHHLAAHAAMMRASWRGHHLGHFATQVVLLAAAYLFDHPRAPRAGIGA